MIGLLGTVFRSGTYSNYGASDNLGGREGTSTLIAINTLFKGISGVFNNRLGRVLKRIR